MPKLLHLIVACAENRVIGFQQRLPWSIPEDLRHFHQETAGKICVLGRVCYETWSHVRKDRRLPVVITSRSAADLAPRPVDDTSSLPIVARDLTTALAMAETLPGDIYVCGGQRIYEETLALDRAMVLHLTLIHAEVPGDTFFPEWRQLAWRERSRRESHDANFRYTFSTLERG